MKSKLARALRKWADLIDPRVGPKEEISFRINIDTSDALISLKQFENAIKSSIAASNWARARKPLS